MLTTERLDEIKAGDGQIYDTRGGKYYDLEVPEVFALIEVARMGVAWAECEAALPEGTHLETGWHHTDGDFFAAVCGCSPKLWGSIPDSLTGHGPTPAAALLALRDALNKEV